MLLIALKQSLTITFFVFAMMVIIDYLDAWTRDKLDAFVKKSSLHQYVTASFLGSTPGCLGAFTNVSLYIHGIISFGALVGGMIATSGDEAFVMLAMFPVKAIILFGILFVIGIISSWLVDVLVKGYGYRVCEKCKLKSYHKSQKISFGLEHIDNMYAEKAALLVSTLVIGVALLFFADGIERTTAIILTLTILSLLLVSPRHYIKDHIWNHITKRHIPNVFAWTFGSLVAIDIILSHFNLQAITNYSGAYAILLLLGALVGIIPESGPNLVFVIMFAKGMIPFSVLLANSIVQDGHGMLPMLSYSLKDSIVVKIINFVIGLAIGYTLLFIGI